MYEIYTLDFYKDHEALTKDMNGILWGSYEDIRFSPINDYSSVEKLFQISENNIFERGVKSSSENKTENSDSPSSMIVLYSKRKKFLASKVELWKKENCEGKDFLSILLLSCDNSENDYMDKLAEETGRVADELNIACSCFGTFGMYNLCVLIRTENINDIFSFVYKLQDAALSNSGGSIKIKTSYTLVCYLGSEERKYLDEGTVENEDDEYIANIQITYANWSCGNAILSEFEKVYGEDFNKISKYNVLGEYDLCLHIPAKELLLSLYREKGLLSSDGEFFKQHIQHCCTRLAKRVALINENTVSSIDDMLDESSDSEKQQELKFKKNLNDAIDSLVNNNLFKNNIAFKRLFHILNIDFQKAYKLNGDKQLKEDLGYQFLSIINCVSCAGSDTNEISQEDEFDFEIDFDFYELISSLAHLFSKSVRNVIFTDELTINEPYTYLDTAALFPNVVYAYTGFIKKLLVLIYSNGGKRQSEIIPITYIDSTINVPSSDLYMLDTDIDALKRDDKTRIISFKLPFDAVLNFESYIPLLIHEVSHYLCPADRELRNIFLFKLMLKNYFSTMLYQIHEELIIDEKTRKRINLANIREYVCEWVDDKFEDFKINIIINCSDFFVYTSSYFSSFVCSTFDSAFSKYKSEHHDEFVGDEICNLFVKLINNWITGVSETSNETNKDKNNITRELLQKIIIIKGKNSECCHEIRDFSDGIREIICDIVMIQSLELQPASYFALVIISMLSQNIMACKEISSIVRFGKIMDYYRENDDSGYDILSQENNILNTIYHLNRSFYETKLKEIRHIIVQINEAIKDYNSIYYCLKDDISSLIDCYSLHTFGNLNKEFKQDEVILSEYTSLLSIFENINNVLGHYNIDSAHSSQKKTDLDISNNIVLMNLLQPQLSFSQLGEFCKKCKNIKDKKGKVKQSLKAEKSKIHDDEKCFQIKTEFRINDECDIERAIKTMQNLLTDSKHSEETLWYRGQDNSGWPVSPSIFRKDSVNFHKKLLRAYELFRAEACEALEIHTNINSDADWIACMQHYFVPTHFLDWSEQPLTSLYFALENYFVNPCKYCDSAIPNCNNSHKDLSLCGSAALFVLNPYRMNRLLKNIDEVPNISIPYNEGRFNNYILNYNYKNEDNFLIESTVDLIKCPPIAVITSQLNSRIRAQKGHFVAYDLRMNFNGKAASQLVNLYALQREYFLQCQRANKEFSPFMGKIIVDYNVRGKLAHLLKAYGVNKSTFYPELMHIGTDITKRIFTD